MTRGEVNWARVHPGHCVIGIVSDITLAEDGSVDPTSGTLRQYDWEADDDDLEPLSYDFYPASEAELL